jgi:TonB family protein
MGYQALLFCSDEKTARTVTQVLNELEFAVVPSAEPFAAVKKLMGEHFDAIVVDCDDEQNATLLFKSARSSTSNQASLAVAVVEGQAGVAKAFRIGANLVLTKPINVEQAKGTLRVARGLLRKGEAARLATPAAVSTTAAKNTTAGTTPAPAQSATPAANTSTSWLPSSATTDQPSFNQAASPVASAPPSDEPDPIDLDAIASDAGKPSISSAPSAAAISAKAPPVAGDSVLSPNALGLRNGTASAPARARKVEEAPVYEAEPVKASSSDSPASLEPTAELAKSGAEADPVAVPSFTFGGAYVEAEPKRGGKKILIGVAAALLVAAGIYVGWNQFQHKASTPDQVPATSSAQNALPSNTQPAAPAKPASFSKPTAATSTQAAPQPNSFDATPGDNYRAPKQQELSPKKNNPEQAAHGSTKATGEGNPEVGEPESSPATEAQPLVVKSGSSVSTPKNTAADTPAPSIVGIATPGSGGTLSNLIPNEETAAKPVLQALNVSQGVSQGLLIKKVQPNYPASALRMHVEGSVQLLATIAKTGNITSVKVISGETVLAKAAMEAVKQWKYKPYYLNGEPVEIQTQITVNFKLPR